MKPFCSLLLLCAAWPGLLLAQPPAAAPDKAVPPAQPAAQPARPAAAPKPVPKGPAPTHANVAYGSDPRQILDFWKAATKDPAPLLFFIHGGGWNNGNKNSVFNNGHAAYLKAGISVVSIHYRLVPAARAAGIEPPVSWPLQDAARALQFVRSKAGEWHLDKSRIAASGGSAGACSSLWLAFHPDMADPASADPVARESTRLACAAVAGAQTTLDPRQMKEWMPNSRYGGHAFGFSAGPGQKTQFDNFLEGRDRILPWIRQYSPYELVSSDDPPVYLYYATPPAMGQEQKDPTHSANFGVGLMEKLKTAGVAGELQYPGAPGVTHRTMQDFVIAKLGGKAQP
jgi:acetyl esterase/lipase